MGLGRNINPVTNVWLPTSASTPLYAWYRADSGTTIFTNITNNIGVSNWQNMGGNNDLNRHQSQAVFGKMPTPNYNDTAYGGNTTFSYNNQNTNSDGYWSSSIVSPITVVIIGEAAANCPLISIGRGDPPYNLICSTLSGNAQFYSSDGSKLITSTTSIASPSAIMMTSSVSGSAIYVGDFSTPKATNVNACWNSCPDIAAGGFGNVAGLNPLTGKIAEIIMFAGILSSGDLTSLKGYLNTTRNYGIAVT